MSKPKFQFNIDENQVLVELGSFGEETLSINGNTIYSSRSLRQNGEIPFEIDGDCFEIHLRVNNPFTGKISCSLFQSDTLLAAKYAKTTLGDKNKILSILMLLIFCGAIGYVAPMLGNWIWITPILFIFAVLASMSCRERKYETYTSET